jgi:endonuclease G, mitochondrial
MRISLLNLFFVFFLLISCKENENAAPLNSPKNNMDLIKNKEFNYLPTSTTNAIYHHKGYSFSYVEEHEQSEWVAYYLEMGKWKYSTYDRPLFEEDTLVTTKSAHWGNYKKSGYTKGHLVPAGDRKENYELYKETFLTSNAAPQEYNFNAGIWNRLENKARYWAEKYQGIYVITGSILDDNLETIGREEVSVPKYFYKVLLTKDRTKMIAFLMPHKDSDRPLYEFVVSVDVLEKKTNIDFFYSLPDTTEEDLESKTDYKQWSFGN